jgi:HlyD family secretion protein
VRHMVHKNGILIALTLLVLIGAALGYYRLGKGSNAPQLLSAPATRRELRVSVSTNGIIEPVDRTEFFAPVDGFVTSLQKQEGDEVTQGKLLMRLESQQIMTALAEAKAALFQARRQAHVVMTGPSKEEVDEAEALLAECEMQLEQQRKDLASEESLYLKGAVTRSAVENLRKQVDLLELRSEALKRKKQDLLARYSAGEKQWEQDKVAELTKQVELLEQQVQDGSIIAPKSGVLYALAVKAGSYVNKGQLLAQVYNPGNVLLRAYVDEPDLGRIEKGQQTLVEWDGLPDRQWTGMVQQPAKQVVALGNRSIGYVICTIDGGPKELIPNINVRVQIVTARKINALVVPRAAVFNRNGQPTVMLLDGMNTKLQSVGLGLVAPEEIEILQGIETGNSVVINPDAAGTKK